MVPAQNPPMLVIPSLRGSEGENGSSRPDDQLQVDAKGHAESGDLEHAILKIDHQQRKQIFQASNGGLAAGLEDLELGVTQAVRGQG